MFFEGSHTLRNERRDFADWHRGRSPYVFWALDVDLPEVRQRVAAVGRRLNGLLLDGYRRQAHVTLELCGFRGDGGAAADEFAPADLAAQIATLRRQAPRPFAMEIGRPASFASAPYLVVGDSDGGIAASRACLAPEGAFRLWGDYVPHVTIGLYADAWPVETVFPRLAPVGVDALSLLVDRVSLMAYEPTDIGGPLSHLGCFDLVGRAMRWHGPALC